MKKFVRLAIASSLAIASNVLFGFSEVHSAHTGDRYPNLAQEHNCLNPQTQQEMNACAHLAWENADGELNRVYQRLKPNLSRSRQQKLLQAQLAWIQFRDAECEFSSSLAEGGTMQPLLRGSCLTQITEERTSDFKTYLRGLLPPAITTNYQTVDDRLNQLYQQLQQQLPEYRQDQLTNAEAEWIEFRDAACEFERSGGGNAAFNNCSIRTTEERVRQLEAHLLGWE